MFKDKRTPKQKTRYVLMGIDVKKEVRDSARQIKMTDKKLVFYKIS